MAGADPYRVLGVPRQATRAQITSAFRRLARQLHPDTADGAGPDEDGRRFGEVLAAYRLLRDPARRADYDRRHPAPGPLGTPVTVHHTQPRTMPDRPQQQPRRRSQGSQASQGSQPQGRRRIPVSRRGRDAACTITIDRAAAGTTVAIPARPGLRIRIPAGTEDGQILTVPGAGMPGVAGGTAGDLYVTVRLR